MSIGIVYKPFTDGIVDRLSATKLGEATDLDSTLGPMVNEKSVAKIAELVDDAVGQGRQAALGRPWSTNNGHYYPPTVLSRDVPDNADMMKEEISGLSCHICNPSASERRVYPQRPTTPNIGLAAYGP